VAGSVASKRFSLVLIKPSHYDDDGYVIQWWRSAIPSNTLAVLNGLALDCRAHRILGDDVGIDISAFDETNTRIRPYRIARIIGGDVGLACLVGVQSNQFPRAMDIARALRQLGVQVVIGGFHVSGTLAMLPGIQPELQEAMDLGISLFAGEAEGRFETVLRDAYRGSLRLLYNHTDDLPNIARAPIPILPKTKVGRVSGHITSFDAGRSCPFSMFILHHHQRSRPGVAPRDAGDIEQIARANVAQDVNRFFITDDNFARNKDWEQIFDRLIQLREGEGLNIKFLIQVDTLCHRLPNLIEKAGRAGVTRVFIGLESINPSALGAAKKRQNRITEYRKMMLMWKKAGAITYAGYILGFPTDTSESLIRDIEIIKRELPIDLLEFFFLTPLPGSEDHQKLYKAGALLDPDLNKYDLEHACTSNEAMSREVWEKTYDSAWRAYYSPDHIVRVMPRARATGINIGNALFLMLWFIGCIELEKGHPLQGGYFRRKYRRDRRPGLPFENPLVFYPRYVIEQIVKHVRMIAWLVHYERIRRSIKHDPNARNYSDDAIEPIDEHEFDSHEMFKVSAATAAAVEKHRKEERARARQTSRPDNNPTYGYDV
jgi:radical SAM superfamily enzyme YgiQ (UPF0313 family)